MESNMPFSAPKNMLQSKFGAAHYIEQACDAPNQCLNKKTWKLGAKLDTLTFTLSCNPNVDDEPWHQLMIHDYSHLEQDALKVQMKDLNPYLKNKYGYSWQVEFRAFGSQLLVISGEPCNPKAATFSIRVEWAMAEYLGQSQALLKALEIVFGPLANPARYPRIKALQNAYDVSQRFADYGWLCEGRGNCPAMSHHTPYSGQRGAPLVNTAYDKAKQLSQVWGIDCGLAEVLRYETRLAFKPQVDGISLGKKLHGLKNPVKRLRPISLTDIENVVPHSPKTIVFWHHINNSKSGLNGALNALAAGPRKKLKQLLIHQVFPFWWQPEKMWKECMDVALENPILHQLSQSENMQ